MISKFITNNNYKTKTMVYSIVLISFFSLLLIANELVHFNITIKKTYEDIYNETKLFFDYKREKLIKDYQIKIFNTLNIDGLKDAISNQNSQIIYKLTRLRFENLKNENPFFLNMHFYDSQGNSIIKINNGKKVVHQNLKRRYSIKKVVETRQSFSTFEESCKSFVFRIMEPIFDTKNKFIGIIEFSVDILYFKENIKEILKDIDTVALVDQDSLLFVRKDTRKFRTFQKKIALNKISHNMEFILNKLDFQENYTIIKNNGITYIAIYFPNFSNFNYENKLQFVLVKEIDELLDSLYSEFLFLIINIIILVTITFFFIKYFLNRYTRKTKSLNDELKATNIELEAIFRASRDGIALMDLETNFLEFNDSYLKMTGFTRKELLTKSCLGMTDPKDMKRVQIAVQQLLNIGYIDLLEKSCIVKDDRKIFIHLSAVYLKQQNKILISTRNMSDFSAIQDNLKRSEEKFRTLLGNIIDVVYRASFQPEKTLLFVTSNIEQITGYKSDNLVNNNIISYFDLIHPLDQKRVSNLLMESIALNQNYTIEYRIISKNNITRWIRDKGKIIKNSQNPKEFFLDGILIDITEKKINEKKIKEQIELINQNVIMSSSDLTGRITDVSQAFCNFTGFKKDELIGKSHSILKNKQNPKNLYSGLWKTILRDQTWKGEMIITTKFGESKWVYSIINPIYDLDGKKVGYTAIREDITDKKSIEQLSITDELTKLYNRRYFQKIINEETQRQKRNQEYFGFAIIDVDFFKQYNDMYGHQNGDSVLIKIAEVFNDSLRRAGDFAFRLGGEEFGIIFNSLNEQKSIDFLNVVRKKIEDLHIEHKGSKVSDFVTISIGLFVGKGNDILNINEIYKLADEALYNSKHTGRNKVSMFEHKK
jgi:diguanylate cyclase (GGDEF)-like protein/PAS domain S-box-containing protein